MSYTGRAPSQAPITSADINDGAVAPADLSTGAPSWDTSGNVTVGGNVVLGDNDKAIFGAGSDLQIYHDGSHSYVQDAGSGHLRLGGTNLQLMNGALTEYYFSANENGNVKLYYDNAEKLATTSTGIDVTGTVTADGLRVDGTQALLSLYETDTTNENTLLRSGGGDFSVRTLSDDGNTVTPRFNIDHATGDISFYEDTGTTVKFSWDASNERLGVGTSSPANPLHVKTADASTNIRIENSGGNAFVGSEGNDLVLFSATTEKMRIDSAGRVTMPYQPAFLAYKSNGTVSGTGTVIVFNGTHNNRGGHYNTSNGRFTAPVAGSYSFSFTGLGFSYDAARVGFYINGSNIVDCRTGNDSTTNEEYKGLAMTAVLSLQSGDYVQCVFRDGDGLYGGNDEHTFFTGHLLG